MQYKTIILGLLEDHPDLYGRLKANRMAMKAVYELATSLRTRHETWKAQLGQAKLGSDPISIASEALELALEEIRSALRSASTPNDGAAGPLSLNAAMDFLRRHTSNA